MEYDIHWHRANPSFRRNQTFLEIINLELNQLKLNFLNLDLIRREISIKSADNPIKEIEQNGKMVKVIPEKIQKLLDKGYDIIESFFHKSDSEILNTFIHRENIKLLKERIGDLDIPYECSLSETSIYNFHQGSYSPQFRGTYFNNIGTLISNIL